MDSTSASTELMLAVGSEPKFALNRMLTRILHGHVQGILRLVPARVLSLATLFAGLHHVHGRHPEQRWTTEKLLNRSSLVLEGRRLSMQSLMQPYTSICRCCGCSFQHLLVPISGVASLLAMHNGFLTHLCRMLDSTCCMLCLLQKPVEAAATGNGAPACIEVTCYKRFD